MQEYDFDAIRIDAALHVDKAFSKEYVDLAGVFSIGEVFELTDRFTSQYQDYIDSTFNFGLAYMIRSMLGHGTSSFKLLS